jgi:hypothetical protein
VLTVLFSWDGVSGPYCGGRCNVQKRFRSHANLPGGAEKFEGLGMALWEWHRKDSVLRIELHANEFLQSLQELNMHVIQSGARPLTDPVSRDVAYSVSCVLDDLAKTLRSARCSAEPSTRRGIECALEAAAQAWSQFLAGDIEDLLQDFRESGLWPLPSGRA